ncbi:MAG: 3-oxoacyl-ACP synthase III family protein [Candidatus Odinarchaeota archaeon]
MTRSAIVTGLGIYLPEKTVTNQDIEEILNRPGLAVKLKEKIGIENRHVMADDETTSDLAAHASREALTRAGLSPEDLDLIILSTDTPDHISPATSATIQHKLGAYNAGTFDINAACAGMVTALDVGSRYIQTDEEINNVLVIGAYGMTKFLDWTDYYTCTAFGDAAGAMVLSVSDKPGFLVSKMMAEGYYHDYFGIYFGGTANPPTSKGIENKEHFLRYLKPYPPDINLQKWPPLINACLTKINKTPGDVDWFFFTQVNLRIIEAVMKKLNVPLEKTHNVMQKWGYTGSACVPLAMYDAIDQGRLQPPGQGNGELIVLCTSGVGANYAAAALNWR